MNPRFFQHVYGVDFSGAKEAGKTIWVARTTPLRDGRLRLETLSRLDQLAGTSAREPALAYLVSLIGQTKRALWAMDFPFGLPTAVMDPRSSWPDLLSKVGRWRRGAYAFGLHCLARGRKLGTSHIYRPTDRENKAPFDCYHYRIIYQTYHGMRDVLLPLARDPATAILPFQHRKLPRAERVLVEACPSSTLKRLGLPHHTYKQPAGGPLLAKRKRTRHRIFEWLDERVEIAPTDRRRIMRDGGGDALDAVLAAAGAWDVWPTIDHAATARDRRTCREGKIYA